MADCINETASVTSSNSLNLCMCRGRAQARPTAAITRASPAIRSSTVNGLPSSTWRFGLQGAGQMGWDAAVVLDDCKAKRLDDDEASILGLFSGGASSLVVSARRW